MNALTTTTQHAADQLGSPQRTRLTRLRPIVHATAVPDGLHVRGWTSSFTVSGGPGLWRLWQALTAAIADGVSPDDVAARIRNDEVRDAVRLVIAQLHEHDMLVELPATWDTDCDDAVVAGWLEAVAPDPSDAWNRLRGTTVTVRGAGRLAAAAIRALHTSGVATTCHDGPPDRVTLTAEGWTVIAGADADAGFATPVLSTTSGAGNAECDGLAAELTARLRLDTVLGAADEAPVLAALVAGVAAHRLLCTVARLPDPAADSTSRDGRTPARLDHLMVFVARLDPLRGQYHPWSGPGLVTRRTEVRPPATVPDRLDHALACADALTDPELGPLPPPRVADLPQTPAGMAVVDTPTGAAVGAGATADVARLHATLGAAESRCRPAPQPSAVRAVGVDLEHAEGVALRRLAHRHVVTDGTGPTTTLPVVAEDEWNRSAVVRQWWKSLTLRLGVSADLTVVRLAPDVHHATVTVDGGPGGWAVEATAANAAATALVAAVGAAQWTSSIALPSTSWQLWSPCGAAPAPAVADPARVPWQTDAWAWPASLTGNEPRLQAALRQLLGATTRRLGQQDGVPVTIGSVFVAVEATR